MNTGNAMESNAYDRLIEHRQIDVAVKADRPPTIVGIETKSVAGAVMPLKPVFSTAC